MKFQVFRNDPTGRHPVGPMQHETLAAAREHMYRCMQRFASRRYIFRSLVEIRPGVWVDKFWGGWSSRQFSWRMQLPESAQCDQTWFEIERISE